jgi:hypothetical protein
MAARYLPPAQAWGLSGWCWAPAAAAVVPTTRGAEAVPADGGGEGAHQRVAHRHPGINAMTVRVPRARAARGPRVDQRPRST